MQSKHVIYETTEEIEAVIKEREAVAAMLPPGKTRQSVLLDVVRLRLYADIKQLVAESNGS